MLGGGGGQTLMITTNPNVQVKLSNEKYSKTITTNAHGQAEFKNLKTGVYSLIVALSAGNSFTKQITINEFIDENLGELKQLKDVGLKQKLKLSNRNTYSIVGKNLSWHKPNSNIVTVLADVVHRFEAWGKDAPTLDHFATIHEGTYLSLLEYERKRIVEQTSLKAHFVTPAYEDLNNLSDSEKIRRDRNGKAVDYWLRETHGDVTNGFIDISGKRYYTGSQGEKGVVAYCDIKGDTWVSKRADGYWHILDY